MSSALLGLLPVCGCRSMRTCQAIHGCTDRVNKRVVGQAGEEEMEFHQKLSPSQSDLSWVLSEIKCASKVSINTDLAK